MPLNPMDFWPFVQPCAELWGSRRAVSRRGGCRGAARRAAAVRRQHFLKFLPHASDRVRLLWQPSAYLAGPNPAIDARFVDI
jgi:hypothetical protein